MSRLVFIIAVVSVGWLLYKLYFKQLLAQGRQGKIKLALIACGLIFMIMAILGKAPPVLAILGAAMTQVMRLLPLLIRFAPMIQQALRSGKVFGDENTNSSKVRTNSLVMTLDHDTGEMIGEIISGEFSGRTLASLNLADLQAFYQYCQQQDAEAVRLLEAWISRVQPEGFEHSGGNSDSEHGQGSNRARSGNDSVSVQEAYEILGLSTAASREDVVGAHRHLMGKMHPDKGGSNYLAAKINAAKKVLIENLDRSTV